MSNFTTISTAKHYDKFIKKTMFLTKEEERAIFTSMVKIKREIILELISISTYRKVFIDIAMDHFDKDSLLDFFMFESDIVGTSTIEEVAEFYDDGMEYILNLSDAPNNADLGILSMYHYSDDVYSRLIDSVSDEDKSALKLDIKISMVDSIRNRLVEKNIAMGIEIVMRYMSVIEVPIEDATQVAMIGVITSVNKHNPLMKIKFSTSAYYWIYQAIQRYDDINSNLIKIPCNIVEQNKKNSKVIGKLINKIGHFPTPDEIVEESGNNSYLICRNTFESLDARNNAEGGLSVSETIPDNSIISISNIVEHTLISNKIRQLVGELEEKEKQIIELSYGWGLDKKAHSNKDIMSKLNLETWAFNKIRKSAYENLQDKIEEDVDFDNWKTVFSGVEHVD